MDLLRGRDLLDEKRLKLKPFVPNLEGIRIGVVDAYNFGTFDKDKFTNAAKQFWELGIVGSNLDLQRRVCHGMLDAI
jgi:hypothetical protein